ncbi:hypothetical protein Pdsh_03675 [Pyrodictium delaneyi]|uniref:Uncharacterized protein n=1 Tax=Pyrodictium delaneyi TaxID=1273541 RepID=A0A211YP63_9CREN|nr:hypothetical protein Pdsh_03675 [Pyrodictium delaneyi]
MMFGAILSINAGRNFARRIHDIELARKYGKRLPGLGLLAYMSIFFALVTNLVAFAAGKTLASSISVLSGVIRDNISLTMLSALLTLLTTVVSYYVFYTRYRNVEEPLTREGKVALIGLNRIKEAKHHLGKGFGKGNERERG